MKSPTIIPFLLFRLIFWIFIVQHDLICIMCIILVLFVTKSDLRHYKKNQCILYIYNPDNILNYIVFIYFRTSL